MTFSRGSAAVEAAIVFPLVVLIVFGVIFSGMDMYASVRDDAEFHKSSALQEETLYPEDILRAKWLVSKGFEVEKEN